MDYLLCTLLYFKTAFKIPPTIPDDHTWIHPWRTRWTRRGVRRHRGLQGVLMMMERLDQLMVELKLIKDQTMSARHCKPSPMKTILLRLMNLVKMTTAESHNQGWQAPQAPATAKGLYLLYPGLWPTQQAVHLSHLITISSLLHILQPRGRQPTLQLWQLSSLCTSTGRWLSVHCSELLYQSCGSLQTTTSTHTHSLSLTTVRCRTVLYTVPAFEPSSLQLQPLWPKWVGFFWR